LSFLPLPYPLFSWTVNSNTAALMQAKIIGFALAIYQSVGYNSREVTRSVKAGREEFAPPHAPMQEAR
ncbi:hypothetical protein, partial [Acutalibacter muris]|uniref:hypothetical protein n=1 Tax=Acutalibacter muris TaxID=1796620 RepID=UPI00272E1858